MSEAVNRLDTFEDIDLPLPPLDYGLDPLWLGITVIICLTLAGWLFMYWRRQPRQRCLQQLYSLQRQHRDKLIDCHTSIFLLSDILRTRFRCAYVQTGLILSQQLQKYQHRWESFIRQLNKLRYTHDLPDAESVAAVLDEATFWLRVWPR